MLWRLPLTLWPWTFVVYRPWVVSLYLILAKSSNPGQSYWDFNMWPNDLEHEPYVLLHSGIIFTKIEFGQPISSWLITFYCWYVMLHCDLDPLTLNICSTSSLMWSNSVPSEIEQSMAELMMIYEVCAVSFLSFFCFFSVPTHTNAEVDRTKPNLGTI